MPVKKSAHLNDGTSSLAGSQYWKRMRCPHCGAMKPCFDFFSPQLSIDPENGKQFFIDGLIRIECSTLGCPNAAIQKITLDAIVEHGDAVLDVLLTALEKDYRAK